MSSTSPKQNDTAQNNKIDSFLDQELRPTTWDEYVGQKNTKDNLNILLKAAKQRAHPPEHLLFYGPPGLGKTTLAYLIAHHTNSQIKTTSGPAIEKVGDIASILTNLNPGDILFIDEVHRLNKSIEEVLYPAMESGSLNIIIGKGPSARTLQLELPPFTLIAATTRISMISSPLRSRFSGGIYKLEFYSEEEIEKILERSAKILGIKIDKDAAKEIAKRSRQTPRTANYLLRRCRDYAQVHGLDLDEETVEKTLSMLQIDKIGLTRADLTILKTIIEKFGGGPVGLNTLATALSEETGTLEEFNEPYLIQLGFIERTQRGRVATELGYKHLGIEPPADLQKKLI
ncbi:MAG TPA: Holliday junction branch migration DNA helicase RuvB [Candidatus Paceibacterota bacterium]|nr:Holliday junction branch migration DNA helicase RuvB [Candidatus Paceibacterota bacterium]HRZ34222.1 Holliday junction branch migration DNA helicase RuvB [Candidatus Paceibacterota bacterium]